MMGSVYGAKFTDSSLLCQVCAVCLDGNVYEENEIVFCEKCELPVHQYCYGIDRVPDGEWYDART